MCGCGGWVGGWVGGRGEGGGRRPLHKEPKAQKARALNPEGSQRFDPKLNIFWGS